MGNEAEQRREDPRPGEVIADKYRIEALIGRGAMGCVYAARNLGTGKRVALKWLLAERQSDMDMIARFEREARAAGRIDHPNVVSVYDVGREGPSNFLVMELLRGYSLYKLMQQGPLPVEAAIQILMPAMRGLEAAHDHRVIHRDIKPENLFICTRPDGSVRTTKVLDFGVSKMTDELREGLSVTHTGVIIGTPYYMSPEQIRGGQDIDHRIDIYAVGVMLYELIAGRPPFVAEHYSGLVVQIATGTPPDLQELCTEVPEELAAVIAKAMAREREDRYQDIASLGVALEPFSGGVDFRVQNPDWTQKIKLPTGSVPPPPPIESPAVERAGSMVDTRVADTEAGVPAGVAWQEVGPSSDFDALSASSARDVDIDIDGVALPATRMKAVAAGGVLFFTIVLAVWFWPGAEPDVPVPPETAAEALVVPAVAADQETVDEASVPEHPAPLEVETESAAATPVLEEPAAIPVVEEGATGSRPRMRRTSRTSRTSRAMAAEESTMTMTRTHRAGALSAEDF